MDTHSTGFGVRSDWPGLNDLCARTGVSLDWVKSDSDTVTISEDVIPDCLISVRATVTNADTEHHLAPHNAELQLQRRQQHWTGLKHNFICSSVKI